MSMMFRDHNDPLYYDAKANDKIFVPIKDEVSSYTFVVLTNCVFQENMTDAQKKIIASFAPSDIGKYEDNAETRAIVETDFVVAGHKKYLAKQIELQERKKIREGITGEESEDSNEDKLRPEDYNNGDWNGEMLDSDEEAREDFRAEEMKNPTNARKAAWK